MKNPHEMSVEEKPVIKKRHHDMSKSDFDSPEILAMAEEAGFQQGETVDKTLEKINAEAEARKARREKYNVESSKKVS